MEAAIQGHLKVSIGAKYTRLRWALSDSLVVVGRLLSHVWRFPEKLLGMVVMPVIFVLLFGYVFGSAISVPGGGDYRAYLMPGIFAQSMAFGCVAVAVGVADDMAQGVIDRFRSLPMARSAVLAGHAGAALVQGTVGLLIMVGCGFVVGWRDNGSLVQTLAAFGLLLLFQLAIIWVGAFIGLLVRTPEAADSATFTWLFPLTFVANTFVPTQGMPAWLRTVADWNPMSAIAMSCRQLFGNPGMLYAQTAWPLHYPITASLGWSLLILAIFVPLAVRRYRTVARY